MKFRISLSYNPNTAKVHISSGNSKIGKIPTFNMLPGNDYIELKNGEAVVNVKGTCGGVCESCQHSCYAVKGLKLHYNAVAPSNGENTLIMRNNPDLGFKMIKDYCLKKRRNPIKAFRFHSSGEIIDYNYLVRCYELAKEIPNIQFYLYTKRFDEVQKLLEEKGDLPSNFVINISEWKDNIKGYNFDKLNKFVWDDGTDPEIAKLPHCPAVSKPKKIGGKGHMLNVHCDHCGLCWRANTGRRLAVYNH